MRGNRKRLHRGKSEKTTSIRTDFPSETTATMFVLGCLLLVLLSGQLVTSMNQHDTATSDPLCENGLRSGFACCPESCGTCGGSGCSGRPGGADSCCVTSILSEANSCLLTTAPCQIPRGDATCCTGVSSGDFCCSASCGTCGGSGCSGRPGGADECCTGNINNSGRDCDFLFPPCKM